MSLVFWIESGFKKSWAPWFSVYMETAMFYLFLAKFRTPYFATLVKVICSISRVWRILLSLICFSEKVAKLHVSSHLPAPGPEHLQTGSLGLRLRNIPTLWNDVNCGTAVICILNRLDVLSGVLLKGFCWWLYWEMLLMVTLSALWGFNCHLEFLSACIWPVQVLWCRFMNTGAPWAVS